MLSGELRSQLDRHNVIMILGGLDTGKTFLATEVVNFLVSLGETVGVVDCDLGQTSIGPPGTLGYGSTCEHISYLSEIELERMIFIGWYSPHGFETICASGCHKLVECAKRNVAKVVIDTTGFRNTDTDTQILNFKKTKIELVKPDCILYISELDNDSLSDWLQGYCQQRRDMGLIKLGIPPQVKAKSLVQRRKHHRISMEQFFSGSRYVTLPVHSLRVRSPCSNTVKATQIEQNKFVGLLNHRDECIGLGIVESFIADKLVRLQAKVFKEGYESISGVCVGLTYFDSQKQRIVLPGWDTS